MKLFGMADNVRNFLEKSMEQWKLSLTSNDEDLGEVDVKRGIFQGDRGDYVGKKVKVCNI